MPKKKVDLTAKNQILIMLTFRKLENNASKIGKILGFRSQQIERELNGEDGLIKKGLVKVSNDLLYLTDEGKSDPLVSVMLDTRRLGEYSIISGMGLIVHLIIGLIFGFTSFGYIILEASLIITILAIGMFLFNHPRILLRRVRQTKGENK